MYLSTVCGIVLLHRALISHTFPNNLVGFILEIPVGDKSKTFQFSRSNACILLAWTLQFKHLQAYWKWNKSFFTKWRPHLFPVLISKFLQWMWDNGQCIHKHAVVHAINTSVIGLIVRFYHLSSVFNGVFCCVEKHSDLVLIKLCLEFANWCWFLS